MVKPSSTNTVGDLIRAGKSLDLTYTKLSTHDFVEDIEFINEQIIYRYKGYLEQFMINVILNEDEYYKYQFNPKVLAHDIYGNQDLYFIILIANDLISDKEFDMKKFKIIPPPSMGVIHDILNKEKKYLMNNNHIRPSKSPESYAFDKPPEGVVDPELINKIQELERELEKIKDTIRDVVADIIDVNFDELLSDRIEQELEKIRNQINNLVQNALDDMEHRVVEVENSIKNITTVLEELMDKKLKDQLDHIIKKIEELDNRHSFEIEELRSSIDDLRKDIDKLLSSNIQDIIDAIGGNLDDLYELLNSRTRDIAFQMFEPISQGVQTDTEFHIPYKGVIESAVMSVRLDSVKTSNIIVIIQRSNPLGGWTEVGRLNLFVDLFYDDFPDLMIPINRQSIRFNIEAGHLEHVKGISIVLKVRELEAEDIPDDPVIPTDPDPVDPEGDVETEDIPDDPVIETEDEIIADE